jgi:hypothetical protein
MRYPTRQVRHEGWRYPFVVPHRVVSEHGLEPIEARLAAGVSRAADDLAEAVSAGSDEAAVRDLENRLRLQSIALRVWA